MGTVISTFLTPASPFSNRCFNIQVRIQFKGKYSRLDVHLSNPEDYVMQFFQHSLLCRLTLPCKMASHVRCCVRIALRRAIVVPYFCSVAGQDFRQIYLSYHSELQPHWPFSHTRIKTKIGIKHTSPSLTQT